jgi:hypothetical protein
MATYADEPKPKPQNGIGREFNYIEVIIDFDCVLCNNQVIRLNKSKQAIYASFQSLPLLQPRNGCDANDMSRLWNCG